MSLEKSLLKNWRSLEPKEQEKVIEYMNSLRQETSPVTYQPQTEIGKKLWNLRQKSLATQPLLTTWEEVEKELNSLLMTQIVYLLVVFL